jgi:pilus assembly protein CpaF
MLLPLLGGPNIQSEFVKKTVGQVVDYVIHIERDISGHRRVSEIVEVSNDFSDQHLKLNTIYKSIELNEKLPKAV